MFMDASQFLTADQYQKIILALPADSADLALLGCAVPVEKIKLLKDAGIPLRWQPLGACYTLTPFEAQARLLLGLEG